MAFLLGLTQLMIKANLAGEPLDNCAFLLLFGVYMGCVIVWSIRFVRSFKPPTQHDLGAM
jgi:hypothetical protein